MNRMQEERCSEALERLAKMWAEGHGDQPEGRGRKKKKPPKGKGRRKRAVAAELEEEEQGQDMAVRKEVLPVDVEILCTQRLPVEGCALNSEAWGDGHTLCITRGEV